MWVQDHPNIIASSVLPHPWAGTSSSANTSGTQSKLQGPAPEIQQEEVIKRNLARAGLVVAAICTLSMLPLQAHAGQCSQATAAGNWAYTYNGTVFVPNPLPIAAVGHFHQDAKGNVTGSQTFTLGGVAEQEDITGTVTVNADCTGTATIQVFVAGQLQRTSVLSVAYDSDLTHGRAIFQSVTLPDGSHLPVVITFDASRVSSKN